MQEFCPNNVYYNVYVGAYPVYVRHFSEFMYSFHPPMHRLMKISASVIVKTFFIVLSAMSVSSCATMFSGFKADIFVDGDLDEPVTINSSAGEYKDVTLPTVVEVKRRQLNGQHIHISSEHYTFDDIVLEKSFNEWAILSALSYGTPLCIDLLTNAVSKPKYNQFYIIPLENMPAVDSLHNTVPKSVIPSSALDFSTKNRLRSQCLSAKYPRHEINGTLGFGANQADRFTNRFVDNILQRYHLERDCMCGDIFGDSYVMGKLEYHYRLNRKWDIGAMMAWGISSEGYTDEYYMMDEQHKNDFSDIITTGDQFCRSFSFAPSARYTWYEKGACRYYSRVALGVMRNHLDFTLKKWKHNDGSYYETFSSYISKEHIEETKWRMAYQISPIGMSVGAGPVRFIAELGYGCLGVCNIGLGFCF